MINKTQKILITGAGGFIGSHLTQKLIEGGNEVHVILREKSDPWRINNLLPRLKVYFGDLADAEFLRKTVKKINPQGIFHLATSTIMSGVRAPNEEVIRTNIIGSANLIDALDSVDYEYFINTGSFSECGLKDRPIKESDVCEPAELYSITKLAQTLYGQAIARTKNKPILTFRIFTPYGPAIQKGRLIYNMIYRAIHDQEINLTEPSIVRDFIYVDDIIELYLEAAGKVGNLKGEIFNAGSGTKTSFGDLADKILEITGSKSKINWGAFPPVHYDSDKWQADMAKTFSKFNWRPKYDLDKGLAKTVDWLIMDRA
ncbi:MAG: NAD-dependent epimerase/dehydratase family protein [Patescibacteria group bacterium]